MYNGSGGEKLNSTTKNVFFWIIVMFLVVILYQVFRTAGVSDKELVYTELRQAVDDRQVDKVTIIGSRIEGTMKDGTRFHSVLPPQADQFFEDLEKSGARIKAQEPNANTWVIALLQWAPIVLLVGIWIFFFRQMQAGGNKALSFGKSKAKLTAGGKKKVTFKDVAGIEEAKEETQEIIEFLKEPQKFQKLGGRIPKGVLLMGPPGTGKTLLARAISGEANVPFFSISGSDFVEMFVGVGASRVRDLFEQGKKNAPCLIFIDEIDAVGRHRGAGLGGGHDEREQTLNQLLVEMDGFESNEGVILIAATNRPDVLDPALLRPGRFDRMIVVDKPDVRGREDILKVHTRNIPMDKDVELEVLARGTPGFVGADLENLVNEAALLAARRNQKMVTMPDFEAAKDKVLMGSERKSLIISEEEKRTTAFHEAGHALVATKLPNTDPIHKVTIIPRGRALGLTQQLPIDDKRTYSRDYLESSIIVLMGGRASEKLMLNQLTTGAGNDIERATELARKMVCEWGMSDKMGPLTFGKKEEQIFLGREFAQHRDYSESTAIVIDQEVKSIVERGYQRAHSILTEHRELLERMARALLEYEVLDSIEIQGIIEGKEVRDIRAQRAAAKAAGAEQEAAEKATAKKSVKSKPREPRLHPATEAPT